MPMNILPVLVDGMWAQVQYGSESSEFSVTFSISYGSLSQVPAYMSNVAKKKKKLIVLSCKRQRQGLDVRAIVLSALQSVNVKRFWEKCMTPVFFQTFQSIRRVEQRVYGKNHNINISIHCRTFIIQYSIYREFSGQRSCTASVYVRTRQAM